MDKKKLRKKIIALAVGLPVLYLASVLLINFFKPLYHQKVDEEYKSYIAQRSFQADSAGDERVRCIDGNEEALLWRLRMIGSAKESIVLTTFDLRTDDAGRNVLAALFEAAERGVKIKLLIDGIYQPVFLRNNETFYAFCAHENVETKIYNPIQPTNLYGLNYRMHDKYVIIDDRMYLLGGRNTTDTFLGEMEKGANIDREVLVYHAAMGKGESFCQLEEYFNQIWSEPCTRLVDKKTKRGIAEKEYAAFRESYQRLLERYGDFRQYNEWIEDTVEANRITLLSNETHAGNKEPRVLYAIGELAAGAKEVVVQTPYVICDKYMYSVLENIGDTSEFMIYLNAVERGSNPWGCTDYLNNRKRILKCGAVVYELMNEYAVHTKAVLVDDRISMVGSYNFDMRSTYLDTELMLVIDSKEFNESVRQGIKDYKEKSMAVSPDGSRTKGSLYAERKMTGKKKALYGALRVVIKAFRHLL